MRNFLVMVFLVAVFEIYAKSYVKRDDQGGTILDHLGGLKESILNDKSIPAAEEIEYINEVEDVDSKLEEGDIVHEESSDDSGELDKRNALRSRKKLWRTKIVPYEVTAELIEGGYMNTIKAAIAEFDKHSCIKWKPHENEPYWVRFYKGTGCWSRLGFGGGRPQDISLGNGCNGKGIAMHEMLHTLGFRHEQSRPDRDKYVEIFWENIKPGKEGNFVKGALRSIDPLEASYDFNSIMHYGKRSFSATGKNTIGVIGNPDQEIGKRGGFSETDIEELNALYDCSNPEHGWSTWSNFGPCNDECFHSRERFCSHEDLSNCPGADNRGVQTEKVECPHEKCYAPLDGHWGRWSSWSNCSVSCDSGTHTRTRLCNDPAPKHGGKNCVGKSEDVGKCLLTVCHLGPYDTAFESEGMHGWQLCKLPTGKPRLEWKIAFRPTDTSGTGPDKDHTSGSGRFIFLETSYGKMGDTDCFYSPEIAPTTCKRFTFWYHMYGTTMGTLRVLVKSSDGSKRTVWERSCQQGLDWLPATVDISSETPFQIYFEGVRGTWHKSDIGIDDVKFTDCPASPSAPPARAQGSPDVCFSNPLGVSDPAIIPDSHMTASSEYRTCFKPAFGRLDGHRGDGWCSQRATSNREWLQVDLRDIFQICGVASQGDFSGDQEYVSAFKLSSSFDGSQWTELKNEDGSEKIFQRNGDSETTDQHELSSPVLARYVRFHPTARNKWNCMRVEVYGTEPVDGNWGSWSSWGACSATCDNGKRTRIRKCDSPAPKPGGKDCVGDDDEVKECEEMIDCDVGPYDTTFEIEGMHGWELCDSNTRPQWYLKSGQTPTKNTGPNGDHTKGGSGRYIYFKAGYAKSGDTACFHSPEKAPTPCQRLTFWYNMYGADTGTLRVLIKSPGSTKTLWEMRCQQGLATEWFKASVDISSETQFQIYFEAVRGWRSRGDIAIDDVKFEECSDAPRPPSRLRGSPDVCFSNPLGVSDPAIIPDSHMTASSEYKACFKPAFGRLDKHRGDGWCSQFPRSNREWLQVDLGDIFQICGVASQGDFAGDQEYVSAFKLSFSSNGKDWTYYEKEDGTQMIFQRTGGSTNTDQHELTSPVLARYVRFHPTARNKWNCMRVEVYGTAE